MADSPGRNRLRERLQLVPVSYQVIGLIPLELVLEFIRTGISADPQEFNACDLSEGLQMLSATLPPMSYDTRIPEPLSWVDLRVCQEASGGPPDDSFSFSHIGRIEELLPSQSGPRSHSVGPSARCACDFFHSYASNQ